MDLQRKKHCMSYGLTTAAEKTSDAAGYLKRERRHWPNWGQAGFGSGVTESRTVHADHDRRKKYLFPE